VVQLLVKKRFRRSMRCFQVILCCLALLLSEQGYAQETAAVEKAPVSASESAEDLVQAWQNAWRRTPKLVTIGAVLTTKNGDTDYEARIKQLGEKTFSNREWTEYWKEQAATSAAVVPVVSEERAAVARAWGVLASDKVENQEKYFSAIQLERDALEDRMEVSFEAVISDVSAPEVVSSSNAYERRASLIADLTGRIALQRTRLAETGATLGFIERQLASEEIVISAVAADLGLAKRELEIAQQGLSLAVHTTFWTEVSALASRKVEEIGHELDMSRARERSRKIEGALAGSQLEFRKVRISELQAEMDSMTGVGTLVDALRQTAMEWLSQRAWQAVLSLLLVFLGMKLALRGMRRGVDMVLSRADDNSEVEDEGDLRRNTLADVFSSVAKMAIYVLAGLIALEQIGVNTSPILGSVAILGLAISFGSQNLVRDVVNGFFILLENQFSVGDVISVNGATGTVERITIRSTWIREMNGDLHTVPNGSIAMVSNLTRGWARVTLDIGVGYESNLGQVEQVVNEVGATMYAAEEWKVVLEETPSWIGVTELADSSVTIRCQVKVTSGNQWAVGRELNRRLKLAFDEAGIEIPYPQQVVRHVGSP
jgi:small-conductance mechanosensitive channel